MDFHPTGCSDQLGDYGHQGHHVTRAFVVRVT